MTVSGTETVTINSTTETVPTVGMSDDGLSSDRSDFNVFVIALSVIQNEVTYECRRVATLILSGFLVVGILLIIPAILQTAAAYLWIGQCRKQLGHQSPLNSRNDRCSTVPTVFRKKNVTDMTRTLFIYRILACVASLLVLVCSTLPQLVLAVANPPKEGNIDQLWGWCHTFVYMDHATRSFATYLIVVPYVLFFWDFLFSEVVPRRRLVMQHIFRGVLISALPIALFSSLIAVPLVAFRYERLWNGTYDVCLPSISGTKNFLVFDFAVTRVAPMIIIVGVTSAFLIWLPRHHYGVFYEPLIFLFLMAPVVFVEATIYIACYVGVVRYLVNEHFANVLLIFYAFYHMSFSSTFVLATLRSVVTEIRRERKARKQFLVGDERKEDERRTARRSNVMLGLQRQFSVVFRWRSECAEDELHLEEHVKSKKSETDLEVYPILEEMFDNESVEKKQPDDVTMHYSILQRSATYKKPISQSQSVNLTPKPISSTSASISSPVHSQGDSPMKNLNIQPSQASRAPQCPVEKVSCSTDSVTHGPQRQSHQIGHRSGSLQSVDSPVGSAVLSTASLPRNLQRPP
ncbi:unnamed protein product [Taenia asiatica]|uniref:G_PROTEIN_RECEP_F1_2 domain-containing protein n=1 Tax=Taenia asiatica TaxID=60517 RepID=A0A0R3W625_TAEAS|nr:unnamed protein product [Taenia asiatica]